MQNKLQLYTLMHKDTPCGVLQLDSSCSAVLHWQNLDNNLGPFLGQADLPKLQHWWKHRAVPGSRKMITHMMNNLEIDNPHEYLALNLALSISDSYWLRPADLDLQWDQVNLFRPSLSSPVPYHSQMSYSPNASLGGEMDKYWDIHDGDIKLVKIAARYFGQQSINEVFATTIHQQQKTAIPYVKYTAQKLQDNSIQSICSAFTSSEIEFIPAYEVLSSSKQNNQLSPYNQYITTCVQHGVDEAQIRDFLDYQTLTDFIISNTDEHLYNFGILRDTNTGNILGPAPIFDSGNSMFYEDILQKPLTRSALLKEPINGLYQSYEKILKQVSNPNLVRVDLLPPREQVIELYTKSGVPEVVATAISLSYERKVLMLDELQHGKSISLHAYTQQSHQQNLQMDDHDELNI